MEDSTVSHYHIIEKLGGGGMGVVYRAEDTRLGRQVALKFLPASLTSDEEAKRRLIQEAKAASAMDHPNLCTIHEIDETPDGRTFVAMAYYDGETLKKKLSGGPLPAAKAIAYAVQIAKGLDRAHESGIIHRDIKPANIMITSREEVKIVDFGLAKVRDVALTTTGSTLGTAAYMSPEQAQGLQVDHRTDLWSLGVVFYEMIEGRRPFTGAFEQAAIYSILNDEPPPLSSLDPDERQALWPTIEKLLQKDPEDRYQHAADLVADLEPFADSGVVASQTRQSAAGRTTRRGLWAALAAIAAAITLLVVFFLPTDQPSLEAQMRALAVLPLADFSPARDQTFFADGMTEALTSELGKIGDLRVISRQSVMRFRDSEASIREIARALDVEGIVEGSVMQADGQVRITVRLVDARSDQQRWAESYSRPLENVLALQSEIATAIVEEIQIELDPDERANLASNRSVNPEAHEAYLRGLYTLDSSSMQDVSEQAAAYFEQAVSLDSSYSDAYVGLAQAIFAPYGFGYVRLGDVAPRVLDLVQQAIAIDSTNGAAYALLGQINFYSWDWDEARRQTERALRLKPGAAQTNFMYAALLSHLGRHDEALEYADKVRRIDPYGINRNLNVGRFYRHARRYEEAMSVFEEVLGFAPDHILAEFLVGMTLDVQGHHEEAIEVLLQRDVPNPEDNWALGYVYARAGRIQEAEAVLAHLLEVFDTAYVPPTFIAFVLAGLERHDEAFAWLERAHDEKAFFMETLKVEPWWDPIRADPRFNDLLRRMDLVDSGADAPA